MSFFKKYIGTRTFYRRILILMLPILLQNTITNFTGLLDNLMVGRLGTEEMSGVSIVNQLFFVYNLCVFGLVSGTSLFGAQSYGRGDHDGVRYTFRFGCYAALPVLSIAFLLFIFAGDSLISLYLHGQSDAGDLAYTLACAKDYLKIAMFGLIPYTISQIYAGSLRSVGRVLSPMVSGIIGFGVNVVLNYVLIFGSFGLPALGVRGAAVATVLARTAECLFLVLYTHLKRREIPFIRGVYTSLYIPLSLAKQISVKGMPLLLNEGLFAFGFAMLNQSFSMRGLATVSAMNITSTIYDSFNVLFISAGAAIAIVLGHVLGAGDTERAKDEASKLCAFALFTGIAAGALLALSAPFFPLLYNTSDEVRTLATSLILVRAFSSVFTGYLNGCYFTVRSGGKTITTFLFDSCFVLGVKVPLSYLLILYTDLSIIWVFLAVNATLILKSVIGTILVERGKWAVSLIGSEASQ